MTEPGIYLQDIPLAEAWQRLTAALDQAGLWRPLPGENVPLEQALGRVTAAPVWAVTSAPHFHAAAMDGYAVRSADTANASAEAPLALQLGSDGPARYVDTGDAVPAWADAVVPIEHIQPLPGPGGSEPVAIEIQASVAPWSHVRQIGEDMAAGELVLPANHVLRPVDLGAIAGCGHTTVEVRRRPRVAVIPTGSHLVPPGRTAAPGETIEYNSLVLAGQVDAWGGLATRLPMVPDDLEQICAAVAGAARTHDLVLLNAGSSTGSADYSARVVARLGQLLVHGVAVRPGHPVILGLVQPEAAAPAVPIIGVPGYPVSAALTGEIFVQPLLAHWLGQSPERPVEIEAVLTRTVSSPLGDDEYLRVTVGQVGERVVATPLARGAGALMSLLRADGLVLIPRHHEGFQAGARVTVRLYTAPGDIGRTIVTAGAHDVCLDLLAQRLAEQGVIRLSSANVGSHGGLAALQRGEAHLAGCHLLDPATGEYNVSAVRRYLPDVPAVLVALVVREQGLLVRPGNPLGLRTLADLARPGVRFVNRQRGAATRALLDFELGKLGLIAADIIGYTHEAFTPLAAAAAVAAGAADCGLGVATSAAALGLDFVPLFKERYDLVIPQAYYQSARLQPLLALLADEGFRREVAALPGYDSRRMGQVVTEINTV